MSEAKKVDPIAARIIRCRRLFLPALILGASLLVISGCSRDKKKPASQAQPSAVNHPSASTAVAPSPVSGGQKPSAGIPKSATPNVSVRPATARQRVAGAPNRDATTAVALPPDTPAPARATLAGRWHGVYTQTADQKATISLRIVEGRNANALDDARGSRYDSDLLTGTLTFNPGGENAASCSLTGNYNAEKKFMVLLIGTCQGRAPDYLQGTIGFSSVNLTDRRVVGIELQHNAVLDLTR